jgi:AraC-like DNA-binding protein
MEHLKVILLVTSFIIPFILAFQIFFSSRKNISKIIMSFALFNSAFIFLFNYFYFQKDYTLYYPLHSIHAGLELWIYPSIYLYIKSIVIENDKIKNELWHFLLGAVLMIFASFFFYVYIGKEDLIFFLKNNKTGYHFIGYKFQILMISRYIVLVIIAIQAVCYSVAFLKIPKEYDDILRTEFSNIENFSINWINKFNLWFGICGLLSFLVYTFTPIKGYNELLIVFVFFVFSGFLCRMGIFSLKQKKPQLNLDEIKNFDIKIVGRNKFIDERLEKELKNYMENEFAYLQADINLTNVSRILGTNRSYLSSIINTKFGMNFNAYINQYRVKYVKDYLDNNPLISKEELVHLGGFGSKSTMNRAMNKMNRF